MNSQKAVNSNLTLGSRVYIPSLDSVGTLVEILQDISAPYKKEYKVSVFDRVKNKRVLIITDAVILQPTLPFLEDVFES